MAAVITLEQIEAALAVHIPATLTISTAIQYPGEVIDTSGINDWVEWWIEGFRRIDQRSGNKDQRYGMIHVQCWSKLTSSRYRIFDMVVDVADALEQKVILLKDYNDSATPQVGYLRVLEASRRDLTRQVNENQPSGIKTVRLSFRAFAQED